MFDIKLLFPQCLVLTVLFSLPLSQYIQAQCIYSKHICQGFKSFKKLHSWHKLLKYRCDTTVNQMSADGILEHPVCPRLTDSTTERINVDCRHKDIVDTKCACIYIFIYISFFFFYYQPCVPVCIYTDYSDLSA